MTSAARPTFLPAVGGFSLNDTRVAPKSTTSVHDIPSHTKLKTRDLEEDFTDQDRLSLKQKLEEKEKKHLEAAKLLSKSIVPVEEDESFVERKRLLETQQLDADDSTDEDEDSDDSDEDSDDDDEAELLRELEKIKKERQEEKERLERQRQEQEEREKEARALTGNPLLAGEADIPTSVSKGFSVKRRWDDDVIFKNQARDTGEKKKRFINDMLRSDFHRKFMDKYIK